MQLRVLQKRYKVRRKAGESSYSSVMNAICRMLLTLALLAIFESHSTGKLIMKPRDTDVQVRHSTYFNCSTDIGTTAIFWFHGTKYVYIGSAILEPYHERFEVDKREWNGTYIYNLVIHSVQPGDAGEYRCGEDEGFGEKYSVQLVVLDDDPICRSNIELAEVIGQNSCNIEPDDVELECSVRYHGNIPPRLDWERIGENSTAPLKVSAVTSLNQYTSTLKLKGDIALNNSSYICGTKRMTQQPNNCTSKVMKILYALSDNLTVHKTTDDEIACFANTSQSCSYKWKWSKDDDVSTESSTAILKAQKPGLHQCEADCLIRDKTCKLIVMRAMVSAANGNVWLIPLTVVLSVIIVASILVGLGFLYFRRKRRKIQAQLTSEEKVLLAERGKQGIRDLTILDQDLFITRYERKDIEVYDSAEFHFKRQMKVDGINIPRSIASCSVNKCLYIVDQSHQELHHAILRIDPINENVINAWKLPGALSELSVASDTNVILCQYNDSDLYEYTADGELIRMIDLGRNPVDMTLRFSAAHAIKLDNGLFVVCQFHPGEVYLISTKETSNTLGRIDEVEILKRFSEELGDLIDSSWRPNYLSVNKEGSILVSDSSNKRAVLLNSNFHKARILISKQDEMESPWKTCFNESTGEWFVADDYRICVCRVKGETIERKIHKLISH